MIFNQRFLAEITLRGNTLTPKPERMQSNRLKKKGGREDWSSGHIPGRIEEGGERGDSISIDSGVLEIKNDIAIRR